jgi:hypothetical protein
MTMEPQDETDTQDRRLELQVRRLLGRVQDFPSPLELADELTRLTEQLEENRKTLDKWADKFFYLISGILGAVGLNVGVVAFKPPQQPQPVYQPPPGQYAPAPYPQYSPNELQRQR